MQSSVVIRHQAKVFGPKVYTQGGTTYRVAATVRHDDSCGNGHNSFSVTGDIERKARNGRWVEDSGGMLHDEIARHFPALQPLLKWHLCSTDGPMHYIANTVYWVQRGNLDHASKTAVWPDATPEQLTDDGYLEQRLRDRLPALMEEFRAAVESIGLVF